MRKQPDLQLICTNMGVDIAGVKRKPLIIEEILQFGVDEEELVDCWEVIQESVRQERVAEK